MKFTYNWLKDFVNLKLKPEQLADKLTMAGLEVTSLEARGRDFIFEIEITSNRPDWLSVAGIAREAAALTDARLKAIGGRRKTKSGKQKENIGVVIENKKDCPLYTAKVLRGVSVGPSVEWLKQRLELIGCRSINNVVDITNYCLFTWGEPLHAFDLDKVRKVLGAVAGDVIVIEARRAFKNEELVTIDGQKRILDEGILVIAVRIKSSNLSRAVAIAGIMGGKDTEVDESTKNVLLEAAVFDPVLIRRGRRRLGMQSDSAYRFERGVDIPTAEQASLKAVELIEELTSGSLSFEARQAIAPAKPITLSLSAGFVSASLGVSISKREIKNILSALGFALKQKGKDSLAVGVPCFRQDVRITADLIEEVARIHGYERIPNTRPTVKPVIQAPGNRETIALIKNILAGLGLNEIITYSLIDRKALTGFWEQEEKVAAIENPLSGDQEVLRPLLSASVLRAVAHNLKQKQPSVSVFEVAKVYRLGEEEKYSLAVALCGTNILWFGQEYAHVENTLGILHVKGILETLFARLGIQGITFVNKVGQNIELLLAGEIIGCMRTLPRGIAESLGIKNKDVHIAELDIEKLFSLCRPEKKFVPFPRYPGIMRDVSFYIKDEIPVSEVIRQVHEAAGGFLSEVSVSDYYKGQHIPSGCKGLVLSCLYRYCERTLAEEEVAPLDAKVRVRLQEKFGANFR